MEEKPFPLCKPPSVTLCDGQDCHCLTPPQPRVQPLEVCLPPMGLQCFGQQCFCMEHPTPPIVYAAPPSAGDACAIAMTLVMAGVKKTLLTCWVSGQ